MDLFFILEQLKKSKVKKEIQPFVQLELPIYNIKPNTKLENHNDEEIDRGIIIIEL